MNFLDFSQSGQFFVISIEYENSNSIVEQFPLVRFHSSIFIFTFVNFFFFNQIESQTHILLETGIRPLNWLTQNYSSTGLNRILSCQIRIHIQINQLPTNKSMAWNWNGNNNHPFGMWFLALKRQFFLTNVRVQHNCRM